MMKNTNNSSTMIPSGYSRLFIVVMALFVAMCVQLSDADAKRKRHYRPPLKILDIAMDPVPFTPGKHPLEITVTMEVPRTLKGDNLLEVSSLISSPTRRSIRFLTHRQPIFIATNHRGAVKVHSVLIWDGKNQKNEFMEPGQYDYEIRAKILTIGEHGPQTTIVSRRAKGNVEVKEAVEFPARGEPVPHHPEHVPFISDDTPTEELEGESEEEQEMTDQEISDRSLPDPVTPPEEATESNTVTPSPLTH